MKNPENKRYIKLGITGVAVVVIGLDYRSLFLHFENNALFYLAPLLKDLKADLLSTQAQCKERTLDNIGVSFKKWVVDGVLRIFAPLC